MLVQFILDVSPVNNVVIKSLFRIWRPRSVCIICPPVRVAKTSLRAPMNQCMNITPLRAKDVSLHEIRKQHSRWSFTAYSH